MVGEVSSVRCIRCPFLHHSERVRASLVTDVALAVSEFGMRVCGSASGVGWERKLQIICKLICDLQDPVLAMCPRSSGKVVKESVVGHMNDDSLLLHAGSWMLCCVQKHIRAS